MGDIQDKGAGKATTYALKNCLLYTFLTPVGKIDDTETTHSENIPTPQPVKKKLMDENFEKALKFSKEDLQKVVDKVELTDSQRTVLTSQLYKL